MHSRVFTYTALEDGSPYCPVALGSLNLARRGVFLKTPREAWERQNFQLRGGVADWPLFCQTDKSTHTLKVRSYIYISVYLFGRKERDIYPSYTMTLILHVNHVYKIARLYHIFLIELSGRRCPFLEGGRGRW